MEGGEGCCWERLSCWIYDEEEQEEWCQMSCMALSLSFLRLVPKCSIRPWKALRSNNSSEDDMYQFANWRSS